MSSNSSENGWSAGARRKVSDSLPSSPPQLIEAFQAIGKSNKSYAEKRQAWADLMPKVAAACGYEEAVALLDSEIGKGADHQFMMSGIFQGVKEDVSTSLARLSDLEKSDRDFAIAGLYNRLAGQNLPDEETAQLISNPEILKDRSSLEMALVTDFRNCRDPSEAKQKLDSLLRISDSSSDEVKGKLQNLLISSASRIMPFDAWIALSKRDADSAPNSTGDLKKEVSKRMISEDPQKAMDLFAKNGGQSAAFLSDGLDFWLKVNSGMAKSWLDGNAARLSPEQMAAVSAGYSSYYSSNGDFKQAWQSVGQIADPKLKAEVTEKIRKGEEDNVIQEAKEKPEQIVNAILSGQSQHDTPWIETAFSQWAAKDPGAAWDWYQQKNAGFNAAQGEAIAAAYTRVALKQGDLDSAAQWAASVSTPQLKSALHNEIESSRQAKP